MGSSAKLFALREARALPIIAPSFALIGIDCSRGCEANRAGTKKKVRLVCFCSGGVIGPRLSSCIDSVMMIKQIEKLAQRDFVKRGAACLDRPYWPGLGRAVRSRDGIGRALRGDWRVGGPEGSPRGAQGAWDPSGRQGTLRAPLGN